MDTEKNQLLQGDHIQYLAKSDIFLVMDQDRIKAYDRLGNEITEIPENEWMYEIAEEYIGMWRNGQTFVVNKEGEELKGPYEEQVIFE